jgi:hypothetical protein
MPLVSDSQERQGHFPARGKVIVRIRLDGGLSILWKGKRFPAEELPIPKKANQTPMPPMRDEDISIVA